MDEKGYIGISNDRLHHILGVARKCYTVAKQKGLSEGFCRKMWLMGWLHDIGYEFSEDKKQHPQIGAAMIMMAFPQEDKSDIISAIEQHGDPTVEQTLEWEILNIADMTINSKGEDVSVEERLEDIAKRYGTESETYITAKTVAKMVGLLS